MTGMTLPGDSHVAVVVALGGNAISPGGERDAIEDQFGQMRRTAQHLGDLLASDRPVVITHGNGPQVGAAILRAELAADTVYPLPLDIVVADLQGGMGYMIAQCVGNELRHRAVERPVTAIVTSVEVAADDPSFHDPSKPVGPFYDAGRARDLELLGWSLVAVPGRGYRRVVASPRPRAVREIASVRALLHAGHVVIAAGGGGVPVVRDESGAWSGREGVIDKDLCAAHLARDVDAGLLLNITGVAQVCLDYGTERERPLARLAISEARRHLDAGQFPRGSMGPKIEAAIAFVASSPRAEARMVITDIEHIGDAIEGRAGTSIVKD